MEREFAYRFPRWSLAAGLILGPLMILAGAAGVIVPWLGGTPFTAESLAHTNDLLAARLFGVLNSEMAISDTLDRTYL